MNTKKLILLIGLASASFLSAQIVVEKWDFDDGTSFTTTSNDGTWSSSWNFNPTAGTYSIDAANSNLVLSGDSSTGPTSTLTDAPVSGGTDKYLFEVTFSGWDFTGVDTTNKWQLAVGVRDSDSINSWLARAWLEYDGTVDLRASTITDGGTLLRNVATDVVVDNSLGAVTHTVGIEFDFATGLVRYLLDGSQTHSWTANTLTYDDINEITIGRFGGTGTWDDANAFVSIDSITLTQFAAVPEPGTFALFAGIIALGAIQIRRRRRS